MNLFGSTSNEIIVAITIQDVRYRIQYIRNVKQIIIVNSVPKSLFSHVHAANLLHFLRLSHKSFFWIDCVVIWRLFIADRFIHS